MDPYFWYLGVFGLLMGAVGLGFAIQERRQARRP